MDTQYMEMFCTKSTTTKIYSHPHKTKKKRQKTTRLYNVYTIVYVLRRKKKVNKVSNISILYTFSLS